MKETRFRVALEMTALVSEKSPLEGGRGMTIVQESPGFITLPVLSKAG
jgi:hypothetical protein